MSKKYRLIKDGPDFKVGEIFTKEDSDDFYTSEHDDEWGLKRMYGVNTVEKNPNFFIDASLPYNQPVADKEGEYEIIPITSHDNLGINERTFQAKLGKEFKYVTCRNCQAPNLIWVRTVKNNKAILVRYDLELKKYFAHWEECGK